MFDIDFDIESLVSTNEEELKPPRTRVHTERGKKIFDKRRFFSEEALLDCADWHFEDGAIYCVISGGDIDSLTFFKHVLRQQKLKYALVSSWCFDVEDALAFEQWVNKGLIEHIDFYLGEISRASYAECTEDLSRIARKTGGRCGIFRNHSKVMLCYGDLFQCAILSSANVNTNPRTENTTIICSREVCDFYKDFFDDITIFNRDFDDWKPFRRDD